jgi:hypothetical protein
MKLSDMPRETVISLINALYNKGVQSSQAKDYTPGLDRLDRDTLESIVFCLMKAEMHPDILSLAFQFTHRAHCGPESITRFATLTKQELFRVHETLDKDYGVRTDVISKGQAIAGVLTFEDEHGLLTGEQRHRLTLILAVAGWTAPIGTWGINKGAHDDYSSINEDALHSYLLADHPEEDFHHLMKELCSGQQYTRFFELAESVNGKDKPLLSGVL